MKKVAAGLSTLIMSAVLAVPAFAQTSDNDSTSSNGSGTVGTSHSTIVGHSLPGTRSTSYGPGTIGISGYSRHNSSAAIGTSEFTTGATSSPDSPANRSDTGDGSAAANAAGNAVAGTANAAGNAVSGTVNAAGNLVSNTANAVGNVTSNAASAVGNVASNAASAVGNVTSSTANAVGTGTSRVLSGIGSALTPGDNDGGNGRSSASGTNNGSDNGARTNSYPYSTYNYNTDGTATRADRDDPAKGSDNRSYTAAAAATDNTTDWGWLGLLGLVGLAGMFGRDRSDVK